MPGVGSPLSLSSSATNPTPGQPVTITAVSYSFDLDSATIIWSVDGKEVAKGIGQTTFKIQAPQLGKKDEVETAAITPDGSEYDASIVIGSGSIDLIVESDGYAPPFFKGKTPLAFQNTATIIAIPHLADSSGKEYDPSTLIYTWKKDDGTVMQNQSGYGKQSISLPGEIIPKPYAVDLTVRDRAGTAQAQSIIQISPTSPSIQFYNDDPLYGPLFNRALGNSLRIGSQKQAGIFAALFSFNFSPKDIARDLDLNWLINGTAHSELASNQSITVRTPEGVAGTSEIELDARGITSILQGASRDVTISFDTTGSTASSTPVTF
jgi:hypothetical protein